jgi:CheY-like chemotaxis protein
MGRRWETAVMKGVVLLVDDDVAFRGLAARILVGWGHDVVEAGSVAEALARVAEQGPQAAVVDVDLPDGDGVALARQLAAPPGALRVVLVSTDPAACSASVAHRAGAQSFVAKDQLLAGDLHRLLEDAVSTANGPT